MSVRSSHALLVLWLALPCAAGPLEEAQRQVKELSYAQAARTLKEVELERGLSREQVLRYYELSGVVAASRGDASAARTSFTRLLVLQPDATLHGRFSPKVTTPFFEARATAKEQPLRLRVEAASVDGEFITALTITREGGDGWVKDVLVELDEDGEVRHATVAESGPQRLSVKGRRIGAVAIARDPRGWALVETAPARFEGPAPVQAPVPVQVVAPAPRVREAPRFRALAVSFAVAGVLGLATGAVGAGLVLDARGRFTGAGLEPTGLVTGMTRAQALQLERDASTWALVADVGFIAGGALLGAAVLTWVLGEPPPVSAGLTWLPRGEGAVLSLGGVLP